MIHLRWGFVLKVVSTSQQFQLVQVKVDEQVCRGLVYLELSPPVEEGDEVIVNTTGVDLKLGTGDFVYILWNLSRSRYLQKGEGHVVKLRYTPIQVAKLSIEEPESPFHQVLKDADNLESFPVLIGSLHSQLIPTVITLKYFYPKVKLAYIMSDGGALPLSFSQAVNYLKKEGLIEATITYGQAFGGDFEAVNCYSALLAAKYGLKVDAALVVKGPGVVGTATKFGHTGLEQGEIANAVYLLSGRPFLIPRISFGDVRHRHQGLSHHFLTVLAYILCFKANVPLPQLARDKMDYIWQQLEQQHLKEKHSFRIYDGELTLKLLEDLPVRVTTMGRDFREEPDYFKGVGAAVMSFREEYERRASG
jgi:hypothetical protein